MNTTEVSRAVSPVVGVILVVAITVALSGVVGVFVFDLGQSVSDSQTQNDIATRTSYNGDGTATVQVVTGAADKLTILVNGTKAETITAPAPGDAKTVTASPDSSVTIISKQDGKETVVSSDGGSGEPEPTAPTQNLIAHYEFEGTADDSLETYNGTLQGSPTLTTGKQGDAYDYDGSSDYVTVPDFPAFSQYTLSAWTYRDTNGTEDAAIGLRGNNGVNLAGISDGSWRASHYDGGSWATVSEASSPTGEWVLWTMVWDGSTLELYKNGDHKGQASVSSIGAFNEQNKIAHFGTGGWEFDGRVDDVRIYDSALTTEEVGDLYNATK